MILLGKLNRAAFIVALQLADPQLLRLLTQSGYLKKGAGRIGQQTKAIDQFDLDLLQLTAALGAGNALVE